MNKKGQTIFFTLMLAITVIILALALAFPTKQIVDLTTNFSGDTPSTIQTLNCNDASISNFDKATCRITDISQFYFIGGLIFLAGGILAARVLL
jgi:hypothetical protein